MPVIPYTFVGMLSGAAVIGTMCLITPEVHPFTELSSSSISGIAQVIYIGLFGTVAGYLLWLNGIRQLGSASASLFFKSCTDLRNVDIIYDGANRHYITINWCSSGYRGLIIASFGFVKNTSTNRVVISHNPISRPEIRAV